MSVGLSVTVLALCLSAVLAVPCGNWNQVCSPNANNTFISGFVNFDGLNGGDYTWNRNIFNDAACSSSYMSISIVGSWIDMEFVNATAQYRPMYFNMEFLVVQPGNAAAASYLNTACPCGGQWVSGTSRNLSSCSTSSCGDTTWLGGTPLNASLPAIESIIIGQPFYGSIQSPVWGTQGSVVFSLLDANSLIGWNNNYPILGNNYQGSACLAPTSTYDICGTWQQWCSPTSVFAPYDSVTSVFQYDGPVPASGFITPSAGVVTQTEFMFADNACNVPFMTVMQTGTMAYQGVSADMPGAYTMVRSVPGFQVTPQSPAAVTFLNTSCPCGGTWSVGYTRLITSCPANSCDTTHWYHEATPGALNYVNMIVQASANFSEVRFTEYASDPTQIPNVFSSDGYPFEQVLDCQYSFGGSNFCGVWHQPCGAYNGTGSNVDLVKVLTITGDVIADGSGKFNRVRTFYNPGGACANQVMTIEEDGYWATDGFSTLTDGGYEITVNIPLTTVTIQQPLIVTYMNTNCPCGGVWLQNVPRVLTTCVVDCDTPYFVAGDLGIPGFGTWRRYPNELRISTLSTNQAIGFSTPIGISDYVYNDVSFCPASNPTNSYCGTFLQPCLSDSATTMDMIADVAFTDSSNGAISIHRMYYLSGSGCPMLATPVINVTIDGTFQTTGASTVITGGSQFALSNLNVFVTTYSAGGAQYLASFCPCNGVWMVNVTRQLSSCPAGSCTSNILRMPTTSQAYGIVQRISGELRMNEFNESASVGYTTQFAETDYAFADVMTCFPPAPAASSSSKSRVTGGDVFLILLFVGLFIYFAAGTAYNYRKNGSAQIPNKEFWTNFPGLVAAGFRFTFIDMFGLRSSSAGYKDLGSSTKESYGTL